MKIAVDVGNTLIKIHFMNANQDIGSVSFLCELKSEDEYYYLIKNQLQIQELKIPAGGDLVYSSVVPSVNMNLTLALERLFKPVNTVYLSNKVKTGLPIKCDNPSEIGNDLLADMVGLKSKYGNASIVVDLGTATKILLLDKDGYFSSAIIMPGLNISMEALASKGEQLPNVSMIAPKHYVARNTIDAMNVGVVLGHIEAIRGIVKGLEKEIGYSCQHVLTGGSALYIKDALKDEFIYDQHLLIDGLYAILEKNLKV